MCDKDLKPMHYTNTQSVQSWWISSNIFETIKIFEEEDEFVTTVFIVLFFLINQVSPVSWAAIKAKT